MEAWPSVARWVRERGRAARAAAAVLLAAVLLPFLNPLYIVPPESEAGLFTLGRWSGAVGPGLHARLPFVHEVRVVPTQRVQRLEIGFRTVRPGDDRTPAEYEDHPEEALMLTGDENIVDVEMIVQWRVADLRHYLTAFERPEEIVRKAAEAALRKVVGTSQLDRVLAEGRSEVGAAVEQELQRILDGYRAGVRVVAVQLQDVEPPEPVQQAFKDVVNALETRQRLINEAERYRNERLPAAQAEAEQILQEAEAYRVRRVEAARGEAARFLAVLEEYRRAPEVTRRRLHLEAVEQVLARARLVVVGGPPGVVPYLPLDALRRGPAGEGAGSHGAPAR